MTRLAFSAQEVSTMRRLRRRRKSASFIGSVLHRSEASIQSKLRSLKISFPPTFTPEMEETARKLYIAGVPGPEIARKLKRTSDEVSHLMRRLEVKSPKLFTKKEKRSIRRMHKAGSSPQQIADKLGRTRKSINHQLSKMKLKSLKLYSRNDIRRIRSMWAAGKSAEEIASDLKRPLPGLQKKLSELQLYSRHYTKAEERKIRKLKRQGLNARQIAAEFPRRTVDSIREKLRRMGFVSKTVKAAMQKRKDRIMSAVEHKVFCEFLRRCTKKQEPIPVLEIALLWNLEAEAEKRKIVVYDKVEYWLKKLSLPVITGKRVKAESPTAHRRRVRLKIKTLHKHLEARDAEEREKLRELRAVLLLRRPRPLTAPCPRCERGEAAWPITPDFFYHCYNSEGELVARINSCILCMRQRRRLVKALQLSGASAQDLAEFRMDENNRTLWRRRELGIAKKCRRA